MLSALSKARVRLYSCHAEDRTSLNFRSLFVFFSFLSSAELISGVYAQAPTLLDPRTLHFFALTRGSGDENSPTRSVLKPWALAILAFYAIPLSYQWFVASFLLSPLGVHHPRWRFAPLTAISNSKYKLKNELLQIILTNATAKAVPYSSVSNIQIYTSINFLTGLHNHWLKTNCGTEIQQGNWTG